LLTGGERGAQRKLRVGADEVEAAELELHLARPDVPPDDRREDLARPDAAVRALEVAILHDPHGRARRAEHVPVLRGPAQPRRRAPAPAAPLPPPGPPATLTPMRTATAAPATAIAVT